jgi:hypothetical protein
MRLYCILGVSVQNSTQLGGRSDFLCPFICSCVSGLMRFRDGSDKGTASVHQILCKSQRKCNGDCGND